MTDQDIDFESLPADVKDKLAELELELSEGKINRYFVSLFPLLNYVQKCPKINDQCLKIDLFYTNS